MRIDRIELENFKCFEKQSFDFSPQFNLLIGNNGSGKTTLLDALAVGMGTLLLGFADIQARFRRSIKEQQEVRRIYRREGQSTKYQQHYPVVVRCVWENASDTTVDGTLWWERSLNQQGGKTRHGQAFGLTGYAADMEKKWKSDSAVTFPLISYYGTGRLWLQKRTKSIQTVRPGSRMQGYIDCLDPASDEKTVLSWIKTMQLAVLQRREPMGVLDAVFAAIQNCVEDCSEVYFDIEQDELIVTVNQVNLPAYLLSDGQRTMLAMVADIAYRAALLNPHLEKNAPQETPGIVLIDELDLHLHPTWQRKIVGALKSTFPKIQFFAATHSPFIIQSLQPGELVDLDGRQAEYADKSIEDIAEQQMGVPVPQRSERYLQMKAAAEDYYRVLEQAKAAPREQLQALEQRLDELSAPFSSDVAYHAFLEMERKAALGNKT